jgi:protein-disulfide isomerase
MWRYAKAGLDVVSTILVCVAAVVIIWRITKPAPQMPAARPAVEAVSGLTIPPAEVAHVRGTGKIALVEFADYECPYCAMHARETSPTIEKELVDSGDIRHVFFNFPLPIHPRAPKASEAAECAANQGRFWEMHKLLFENPTALEHSDLMLRAESIGLDPGQFAKCLESGEMMTKVQQDMAAGRRLGVNSTPSFFIGTVEPDGTIALRVRMNGTLPFQEFEKAVRDLSSPALARR